MSYLQDLEIMSSSPSYALTHRPHFKEDIKVAKNVKLKSRSLTSGGLAQTLQEKFFALLWPGSDADWRTNTVVALIYLGLFGAVG